MSSLVDYGSSDESENESTRDEDSKRVVECELPVVEKIDDNEDNQSARQDEKDLNLGLFSSLPPPKEAKPCFTLGTDDERLIVNDLKHFKKKQPVKITIPSLSKFRDDESEPAKKKLKPSLKGSGLFAILPAPKNLSVKETKRPLVPHVLTKKPPTINPAASIFKSETDDLIKNGSSLISYEDSEEESDGEGDFFSLKMDHNVEGVNCAHTTKSVTSVMADSGSGTNDSVPANKGDALKSSDEHLAFKSEFNPSPWASGPSQGGHEVYEQCQNDMEPTTQTYGSSDDYISVQQEDLQLNDEALQRLCGRRAKRQQEDMQLIEVSGDAIMPDPNEWLTKQMTQEQETKTHSHRKNDGPTTQQRRKHQITYLAFQAKENELELKNQWSQNRMSRKQTQSKYGF